MTSQFYEFFGKIIDRDGLDAVADAIGSDASTLSRFRSGERGLCLDKIELLFKMESVRIVPDKEMRQVEDALLTVTKLWEKDRRNA